ncbi:MAG: glycosyltransferase family 4 protein [Planctomycetota bacterium]|jgi:glycosyltransferase involved in cell wall biosynthesis
MNTDLQNILFLSTARHPGGAELSLLQLVREIDNSKFKSTLILPADIDRKAAELYTDSCHEIIKLKIPVIKKHLSPIALYKMYKELKAAALEIAVIISDKKIDILHANNDHAALLSSFIPERPELTKVWHKRDLSFPKYLCRWIMARQQKIIAVSNFVKDRCAYLTKEEIPVCYSGVDSEPFLENITKAEARERLGIPDKFPVILNVGNYAKWKSQDLFIRLTRELKHTLSDITGIIAGKNSAANDRSIMKLNLEYQEMKYLYAAADLLINTTAVEPLGRSIIEAIASGTPVVSVPGGGVEEIINLTKSGAICKKNTLNSFVSKMLHKIKLADTTTNICPPETSELIRHFFAPAKTALKIESVYHG